MRLDRSPNFAFSLAEPAPSASVTARAETACGKRHFELQEAIWRLYRPLGWTMVKIERAAAEPAPLASASEETLDARPRSHAAKSHSARRAGLRAQRRGQCVVAHGALFAARRAARDGRAVSGTRRIHRKIFRDHRRPAGARIRGRHAGLARPRRFGARTRQSAQGPCRRLRAISARSLGFSGRNDAARLPEALVRAGPFDGRRDLARIRPWRRRPFRAAGRHRADDRHSRLARFRAAPGFSPMRWTCWGSARCSFPAATTPRWSS